MDEDNDFLTSHLFSIYSRRCFTAADSGNLSHMTLYVFKSIKIAKFYY